VTPEKPPVQKAIEESKDEPISPVVEVEVKPVVEKKKSTVNIDDWETWNYEICSLMLKR
jgi:hypothetical protein